MILAHILESNFVRASGRLRRVTILAVLSTVLPISYGAQSVGNPAPIRSEAEHPKDCSAYAAVPLPADAKNLPIPKVFPACASYRSYRGIGRSVNYSEARACAWQERQAQRAELGQNPAEPTTWIVGGSLILADIYFNGAGVKRDVPLAIRFACESEEGMATLALRDISKANGGTSGTRTF